MRRQLVAVIRLAEYRLIYVEALRTMLEPYS